MAEAGAQPDITKIRALIALMKKRGLSRLVLNEEGVTVRLETASSVSAPPEGAYGHPAVSEHAAWPISPLEPEAPAEPEGTPLISPTTGTFYRSPAPGEPPFVDVGDVVEVGQTVGIIMAMKVMSEIPAEVAGEIVAIPAGDAELIYAGAPVVVVRPL